MEKLTFEKIINAPAQHVWKTLWSKDTYGKWTRHFSESSQMQTDWQINGKTYFLDASGKGMVSTIKKLQEPEEIIFEHKGNLVNGVEDTKSKNSEAFAGSQEKYLLNEKDGITTLTVSVEVPKEFEQMMKDGFEKGLKELKTLSENLVDTPKAKMLEIVIPAYRMHTQLFNNMLNGITEESAQKRIDDKTNHMIWMVGNLVNDRYWMANLVGISDKDPNENFFKEGKAIDMKAKYPTLDSLKNEWHHISPKLYHKLLSITDDELNAAFDFGEMAVSFIKQTKLNMIGMCMDRENYLFGQMGLMRKLLGYAGVSHDIDESLNY